MYGGAGVSLWRLAALVLNLPPDSAVARRHATDTDRWTVTDELLATIAEVVDVAGLRVLRALTTKKTRMPKAITIPRPYLEARREVLSMSDPRVRAFFGAAHYVPKPDASDK